MGKENHNVRLIRVFLLAMTFQLVAYVFGQSGENFLIGISFVGIFAVCLVWGIVKLYTDCKGAILTLKQAMLSKFTVCDFFIIVALVILFAKTTIPQWICDYITIVAFLGSEAALVVGLMKKQ